MTRCEGKTQTKGRNAVYLLQHSLLMSGLTPTPTSGSARLTYFDGFWLIIAVSTPRARPIAFHERIRLPKSRRAAGLPRRSVHCRAGLFARYRVVRFALASACGLALRDRFSRRHGS